MTCQIDGHNRFEILTELNIEPKFEADSRTFKCKEEAMIWIIENQILKRNVKSYVLGYLCLRKKDLLNKIGRGIQGQTAQKLKEPEWLKRPLNVLANSPKHNTRERLAKEAGIGSNTLNRIAKIEAEGSEDLKERCRSEDISINAAYKELRGLNGDDAPLSKIDELIEKIADIADKNFELSEKIFSHNDELNDGQREEVFEAVDVNKDALAIFSKCVHESEECIPNIPTFGDSDK